MAPATPTYWAMTGYRAVVLDGVGVTGTLPAIGILLLFAVVLVAIAGRRFSFDETKIYLG